MNNRTLCLSALIAVFFALTLSASAQRGVQNDYKEYQRLFLAGAEPDLSPEGDTAWRRKYERNGWAEEAKDGNTEAQTLTAIWNVMFIDQQLNVEIERIVLSNPMVSSVLASTVWLDNLANFFADFDNAKLTNMALSDNGIKFSGIGLPVDGELYKQYVQKLDSLLRKQITQTIPVKVRQQAQRTLMLFYTKDPEESPADNWAEMYYYMAERMGLLDKLKMYFYVDNEQHQKRVERILKDDDARKKFEELVRAQEAAAKQNPADGNPVDRNGEDQEKAQEKERNEFEKNAAQQQELAKKVEQAVNQMLAKVEARYKAHQYVVGEYQGFDYHLARLKRSEKYLRIASEAGDPVSMYHYGCMLHYFGEWLHKDPKDAEKWWKKAAETGEPMKKRVEQLEKQIAFQNSKAEKIRREKKAVEKLKALVESEEDKIDVIDNALIQAAQRQGQIATAESKKIEHGRQIEILNAQGAIEKAKAGAATAVVQQQMMIMLQQRQQGP